MKKSIPYILIVIAALSGIIFRGGFFSSDTQGEDTNISQQNKVVSNKIDNQFDTLLIYPKKNLIPDFQFNNHLGDIFTNNDFKGYWNLIFIGFTNCPDVCPNTLNQMVHLYNAMDETTRSKFQFAFLTVDPERDTIEHLNAYIDYFHSSFIGLHGKKEQIDPVIRSLGGIYTLNKDEGEYYSVDHSSRIFIVGPKADRFGIIESGALKGDNKLQLAKDLTTLSSSHSSN